MHDAFDWWANIWIPALVGGVTLITAVASLVVAVAALRTARAATNLALEEQREQRLRERRALAPRIKQWVDQRLNQWGADSADADTRRAHESFHRALRDELMSFADRSGLRLFEFLLAGTREIESAVRDGRVLPNDRRALPFRLHRMIDEWSEDPRYVEYLEMVGFADAAVLVRRRFRFIEALRVRRAWSRQRRNRRW